MAWQSLDCFDQHDVVLEETDRLGSANQGRPRQKPAQPVNGFQWGSQATPASDNPKSYSLLPC